MSDLKQCPCGATPTKLAIVEGSTFRWRVVSGGCCGDWEVEVRVPTVGPEANEEGALAACVREWNAMPRGWEARIAELEKVAIHAQFYLSGLPDADGYELGEALRAAGYLGEWE